jgi:hypothetical protein
LSQNHTPTAPARLALPDLDTLGLDAGGDPAAFCAAVGKTMKARGYQAPSAPSAESSGASCRFITSGLSLLTDGSPSLNVDVAAWRDSAEKQYGVLRGDFERSEVTSWPVGDIGFVGYQEQHKAWSGTTAVSRAGDDLMAITLWGSLQRDSELNEPLAKKVALDEITDILRALSGDGEPRGPRIVAPPTLEHAPYLTNLTAPRLPVDTSRDTACAAFGDIAGKTGTQADFTDADSTIDGTDQAPMFFCEFKEPDPADRPEGDIQRQVRIRYVTYHQDSGGIRISNLLTQDLLAAGATSLYELPVGDGGFVAYSDTDVAYSDTYRDHGYSETTASYVVNSSTYVRIYIRALVVRDGKLVPLPEETAVKDIATLLT